MARLTAQVAFIGIGRLLTMATAAGTMMVLARIMPDKERYGTLLLVITLNVMLSQVFAAGLPQSIYYFLPRYSEGERRGFLTQIVLLLLVFGAILGVIFYAGAHAIGTALRSPGLPELLRVFAWYPIFMLPTNAVESALLSHNRPIAVMIYNVLIRVGMFCALVIPTWLGLSLPRTVSIWVLSAAIMFCVGMALIWSTVRHVPAVWNRRMLQDTWRFSLPLAALTLISMSIVYSDRFIVSRLFGTEAFGIYNNATVEIPTVTMVTSATAVVLLAEFSRQTAANNYAALLATWHRATIKTGILILASFGFLVYWGHETMRLLFSARFSESGAIFSILAWGIPFYLFALRPLFVASGRTLVLAGLSIFDIVNYIFWMLLMCHFFGLEGVAYGTLAASCISVPIWIHIYVRHLTKIGWRAFMPWKTVALIILVALAAGGISRLLYLWLHPAWPMLVTYAVAVVIYLPCYAAGLYLTRLLDYVVPPRFLRRPPTTSQPSTETTAS